MRQEGIIEETKYKRDIILQMYEKNDEVLLKINFKLLEKSYIKTFGIDKINKFSCFPDIQNQILTLTDSELNFFSKCLNIYMIDDPKKRWEEMTVKILDNIQEYSELIENIKEAEEIDIEKLMIIMQDKNKFNITTLQELENYEEIKRAKCDKMINSKDCVEKREAIFQKIFGHSTQFAEHILDRYGKDINTIESEEEKNYVKTLQEIFLITNADILNEIYEVCDEIGIVNLVDIEKQLKREYCKQYNKDLLKIEGLEKGEEDNTYEAGTEFKVILTSLRSFFRRTIRRKLQG